MLESRKILVVDDEKTARRGLAELLKNRGYEVRLARSGKEAVKKVQQDHISMLLMDIRMPGDLDGIDAAREIQRLDPQISILFVTAWSEVAEYRWRVQEADLKIGGWFDKPIAGPRKEQLLSTIDEEFQRMRLRKLVESAKKYRVQSTDALHLLEEIAAQFDINVSPKVLEEIIKESIEADLCTQTTLCAQIVEELSKAIDEARQHFLDIQQRQFAFAKFRSIVMDQLWNAYPGRSKYHRQLAMLIRMSVRKLSSLQLTERHLTALESVLERLSSEEVTLEDVVDCKKTLRQSEIETVIKLGEKTDELIEIYDEGVMNE